MKQYVTKRSSTTMIDPTDVATEIFTMLINKQHTQIENSKNFNQFD